MTIKSDNAKVTVDFGYESSDGQVSYKVRFHDTQELGDTISLSEDGDEYTSFPAEMFIEVSNFIMKRGLVKKSEVVKEQVEKTIKINKPKQVSSVNSLPVPNIEQQAVDVSEENLEEEEVEQESGEPLQSFISQDSADENSVEVENENVEVVEPDIEESTGELPVGSVEADNTGPIRAKPIEEEEAVKLWEKRESNPEKRVKRKEENKHGGI
jgi:hypothetical protein